MIYLKTVHHTYRVKGATLKPGDDNKTMDECEKEGIEHITLVGWPEGSSLEFLRGRTFIKSINIHLDGNIDISPINSLVNLVYFESGNNRIVGMIDFENFPNLQYLNFGYSNFVFKNFHSLKNLTYLVVNNWPFEDLNNLSHLSKIEVLELDFSKKLKTLAGVSELKKLNFLTIHSGPKLEQIAALAANADTLKRLSFELVKKVQDFQVLDKLVNLERFYIYNSAPIHSIQWLKKLPNLKYAYIGTEVLDRDVVFLKEKKIEYKKLKKYTL